jgi:RNA polymerase sigma factor (sigma-70 family)
LLRRFLGERDDQAFAELVARHGSMVYGVCLRRLGQCQDAEDAFQAVFLALATHAEKLVDGVTVGPWLYTVARQVSTKALRSRRRRRWAFWGSMPEPAAKPPVEVNVDLDAALATLNEQERSAIILCHLEGMSRSEAAKALGCPEGTLSARLSRALEKLRRKLGKPPLAILAAATMVIMPEALPGAALGLVRHLRDGTLDDWASPRIIELSRRDEPMTILHRAGPIAAAFVAVMLILTGIALGRNLLQAQQDELAVANPSATEAPKNALIGTGLPATARSEDDFGSERPLADAIRKFNERAKEDPIGKEQPPLTVDEVVAAIHSWPNFQSERKPAANLLHSALSRVADSRKLPPGSVVNCVHDRVPCWRASDRALACRVESTASLRRRVARLPIHHSRSEDPKPPAWEDDLDANGDPYLPDTALQGVRRRRNVETTIRRPETQCTFLHSQVRRT